MDMTDDVVIPSTPRITNAANVPKAPWETDDQIASVDVSTTTPAPAAVTAPGAASLSQPAPRIVLAPVPKMGKRAKDKEQASPAVRTSEPALALAATDAQ